MLSAIQRLRGGSFASTSRIGAQIVNGGSENAVGFLWGTSRASSGGVSAGSGGVSAGDLPLNRGDDGDVLEFINENLVRATYNIRYCFY